MSRQAEPDQNQRMALNWDLRREGSHSARAHVRCEGPGATEAMEMSII